MDVVIELRDIVKEYDGKVVVDKLNLRVKRGEIFGLLGPNGAGKSTSINIMVGLLKPSSGEVLINNKQRDMVDKKDIGVCPQDIILWDNLTCYENLYLMGKMYEVPRKVLKKRIDEILDRLILKDQRNTRIKNLSGGMKRRMNIAMATIHKPSIIVLDEPSEGLDPQSRRVLWDYILYQKELNNTIILTTHLMDEADKLSDTIAILDHGRLLSMDTPVNLKNSIGQGDVVEITLNNTSNIEEILNALMMIEGCDNINYVDNKVNINLLNAVSMLPDIIHAVDDNNTRLTDLSIRQSTLEDVFIELTGRHLRE